MCIALFQIKKCTLKNILSVPASSNGGKGFQIFSGEYQPLVFRATRYTVAKVTFIGILSFMLFRLWREIDKKRKRTKGIHFILFYGLIDSCLVFFSSEIYAIYFYFLYAV